MYVIATAGHVDHGKSTLVRALTGMEPDRWAEERKRGLTIDLGFAWTSLPSGEELAFVDVPGHERFVPNMLAGVGTVPAVMFVVAADEGWMPQSAEHLAALDALGVKHGLLVVTRADLASPKSAVRQAKRAFAGTSLAGVRAVVISGKTGIGLHSLRASLAGLVRGLPLPEVDADVRLWVDRSFTVKGAGTVVTGTLSAGTLRVGDALLLNGERVHVRGLQSLGAEREAVAAVARVAVNLRGVPHTAVGRGDALLTPDAWWSTEAIDVRLRGDPAGREFVLHLGSAAVPCQLRLLGEGFGRVALARPLPLRVGDRGLLRDPGRQLIAAGVVVADVRPPPLRRRGAAAARAADLARTDAATLQLRDHGFVRAADLTAMGLAHKGKPLSGGWLVDAAVWHALLERARTVVADWCRSNPLAAGMPADVLRQSLGAPGDVIGALVEAAGLSARDGRVAATPATSLPREVELAVLTVERDLADAPFAAPTAVRLAELGLGPRPLAAAVRVGRLTKLADGVVVLPSAIDLALAVLAGLPQPFTLSEARDALHTTRRVALPLLELLQRSGRTERLPDGTHRIRHS